MVRGRQDCGQEGEDGQPETAAEPGVRWAQSVQAGLEAGGLGAGRLRADQSQRTEDRLGPREELPGLAPSL